MLALTRVIPDRIGRVLLIHKEVVGDKSYIAENPEDFQYYGLRFVNYV